MSMQLSLNEKRRLLVYLKERDGWKCIYCRKEFKNQREPIIEHLNDDRNDNRWDNLVLAHQSCNIEKASQKSMEYYCVEREILQKWVFRIS